MLVVTTNRKGGSSKTTLAVSLAAAWAQGQRTLLVDLDEQGDASVWLGVEDTGEGLADALAGRTALETAIRASRRTHPTPPGPDSR